MKNDYIDVLIRFHDLKGLHRLRRALFSVYCQRYKHVRPVLLLQNMKNWQLHAVEKLVAELDWSSRNVLPKIISCPIEPGMDGRSRLINIGIAATNAQYIALLDYDDMLFPHAYEVLVAALRRNFASIAFGRIVVQDEVALGVYDYALARQDNFCKGLLNLFRDNQCPIHSFIIDRNRVDAARLRFDERLNKNEDYDMLLRLCSRYRSDFSAFESIIGLYCLRTDGSNTVLAYRQTNAQAQDLWAQSCASIKRLKKRLCISDEVVQQLWEEGMSKDFHPRSVFDSLSNC